ncbi:MAG: hypothetical protein NUV74_18815 [Candidatus Brocadiaceae bacterium]|nr:hypothetical protein [Candidatus Brocadiaceae bacterium]
MTQEFAKTPIIGQQGEIRSRSFLRKNQKKACILLHFCIIILLKGKAISYHLILTSPRREDHAGSSLRNNKFEHDHQMSIRQVGNGQEAETHGPSL